MNRDLARPGFRNLSRRLSCPFLITTRLQTVYQIYKFKTREMSDILNVGKDVHKRLILTFLNLAGASINVYSNKYLC